MSGHSYGPPPTRKDHERFCEVEGWRRVLDARGRAGTDHIRYELHLPDGRVLRTRISRPADASTYGPNIWSRILRDQLEVGSEVFWACAKDGKRPNRGAREAPPEALPASIVHQLIHHVGLAEDEVRRLTRAEAVERLNDHYRTQGS